MATTGPRGSCRPTGASPSALRLTLVSLAGIEHVLENLENGKLQKWISEHSSKHTPFVAAEKDLLMTAAVSIAPSVATSQRNWSWPKAEAGLRRRSSASASPGSASRQSPCSDAPMEYRERESDCGSK